MSIVEIEIKSRYESGYANLLNFKVILNIIATAHARGINKAIDFFHLFVTTRKLIMCYSSAHARTQFRQGLPSSALLYYMHYSCDGVYVRF